MQINGKTYRTIWFDNNVVKIIDQTKLPHKFIIKDLKTTQDAINAIKTMEVRGAPLIGATAAYGLVLSIIEKNDQSFFKASLQTSRDSFGWGYNSNKYRLDSPKSGVSCFSCPHGGRGNILKVFVSCPHRGRGKYFGRTYPRKNDQPPF